MKCDKCNQELKQSLFGVEIKVDKTLPPSTAEFRYGDHVLMRFTNIAIAMPEPPPPPPPPIPPARVIKEDKPPVERKE